VFVNSIPDISKIAASFNNSAVEYDRHVLVQKRVVSQLVSSIVSHLDHTPEQILDIGTGTGSLLEKLHARFPAAGLTGIDIALNMCTQAQQKLGAGSQIINADAEDLPFKAGTFDLVVSASALQWVGDLSSALHEMRRVLRPGGEIRLAFFCAGTLSELHSCFQDIARVRNTGDSLITSRLHGFRSVDEVTTILEQIDFEQFVVTVETEVDWYDDLNSLLRSIKNIGAGSVSGGSGRGLGWRGILHETELLYRERYGDNGRIPVTYKVLCMTASTGAVTNKFNVVS
jgi:malonyl-CoA O-methyltransferase